MLGCQNSAGMLHVNQNIFFRFFNLKLKDKLVFFLTLSVCFVDTSWEPPLEESSGGIAEEVDEPLVFHQLVEKDDGPNAHRVG